MKLNEDLFLNTIESDIPDESKFELSTIIIDAIKDEYESIDKYNGILTQLNFINPDSNIVEIISNILNDENTHVNQLQSILNTVSPETVNPDNIDESLVEALSEQDKVRLWNDGTRNVNIKACSDSKLQRYYKIASDNQYDEICQKIEDEAQRRGLSIIGNAGVKKQNSTATAPAATATSSAPAASPANTSQQSNIELAIDMVEDYLDNYPYPRDYANFTMDDEADVVEEVCDVLLGLNYSECDPEFLAAIQDAVHRRVVSSRTSMEEPVKVEEPETAQEPSKNIVNLKSSRFKRKTK